MTLYQTHPQQTTNAAGPAGLPRVAFSEAEAAKMIGVCSKTLANARREGRISWRREGVRVLYTLADIHAYLDSIKQPATAAAGTEGER